MHIQTKQELVKYLKLYLIFEIHFLKLPIDEFLERVFSAGITSIQLRCKGLSTKEMYKIGLIIKKHLYKRDVLFIVNDRADLALLLHANGFHIGKEDLPLIASIKHFKDLIVGYSCNCQEDIRYAARFGANYVGIGSIFPTNTKKDVDKIIGIETLKTLVKTSKIPTVAIGGINEKNISLLKDIPVNGVAISSAICSSYEPEIVIKKLKNYFDLI